LANQSPRPDRYDLLRTTAIIVQLIDPVYSVSRVIEQLPQVENFIAQRPKPANCRGIDCFDLAGRML
jgi:hypothetical protein